MSVEEKKKAAEQFHQSIDLGKSLIEVGKASIEFLKEERVQNAWKSGLTKVAGVGEIIKGILSFVPSAENPMVQQMKDLTETLKKLGDKVSANFDEMKIYVAEINFFVRITSPTYVLMRYMIDCIDHPGPDSKENFRNAYLRHPPMKLVYNLMSYLDHDSTNPLRLAMDAEKVKTRATFNKWEDIILRIMGQFMFIEAFANGILEIKSKDNFDLLIDRTEEIIDKMDDWKQEYMADRNYWDELRAVLPKWLNENAKLSNTDKADAIKARLEAYLTGDAFYVAVYDHYRNHVNYWADDKAPAGQFINCFGPGGGNTFVYRSDMVHQTTWYELHKFQERVQNYINDDGKNVILQQLKEKPIDMAGMTKVIGGLNEQIRAVNFARHEKGPGWWTEPHNFGGPARRRLLVGYL
uniref:Peptidase_M13_N domain-containing protein n=1 Tax=Caenorhabditis tropicalis TaxID=1561998 RepID=A0A1I7UE59_9PELO